MKLYKKSKYKYLFQPTIPMFYINNLEFLKQNLNIKDKLKFFIEYDLPKMFYVGKRKKWLSSSAGHAECMTAFSIEIWIFTYTLLDYLSRFKKQDLELKYNLEYLEVVNTALLHSWPHTRLCRISIILSQEEALWQLLDYVPFIPDKPEIWKEELESTKEHFFKYIPIGAVNEPVFEEGVVDEIMRKFN